MRDLRAERRRHPDARPVPAPVRRPHAARPLLHARRVRRAARRSGWRWASRTSSRARSPGRRYHAWEQVRPPARESPSDREGRLSTPDALDGRHRRPQGQHAPARPRSQPDAERVPRAAPADDAHPPLRGEGAARPTASARSAASATSTSGRRRWPSAASRALRPDDYITCSYRDHGHALARGHQRRAPSWPSCSARPTGCSRRQGRLDAPVRRRSSNFLGGHGIVGGHIPLATGIGFAIKYRGGDQVCVCFFGEAVGEHRRLPRGAQHGGALEAAGRLHLREQPLRHGHGARARQSPSTTSPSAALLVRHGQRGRCDGQDVLVDARGDGARRSSARATSKRPTLLEVRTYRFMGHSMSDPSTATTAPRKRSRSSASAIRSRSGRSGSSRRGCMDEAGGEGDRRGGDGRGGGRVPVRRPGAGSGAGGAVYGCVCGDDAVKQYGSAERSEGAMPRAWPVRCAQRDSPCTADRHGHRHLPRRPQPGPPRGDAARRPTSSSWARKSASTRAPTRSSQGCSTSSAPMRVVDTPITELGFAGVGVGAAMVGLRPVIEFMTWNFALLALDQLVNSAAKMRYMSGGQFNMPIGLPRAGRRGAAARARSTRRRSRAGYAHIPGLKVVTPATPADAKGLLKSAIRDDNPVVFIEGEMLYNIKGEVPDGRVPRPARQGRREARGRATSRSSATRKMVLRRAQGRRAAREGGHRRRGRRPPHAPAARHRGDPRRRWPRPTAAWSRRKAGRSPASARRWWTSSSARLRRARRAGPPRHRRRRADAVQQAPREGREGRSRAKVVAAVQAGAVPRLTERMATKVVMEALSPTMEEGRLVEWKKKEGDAVAVGDVLAEVETDKAIMELVARAGGTLLKQVVHGRRRRSRSRSWSRVIGEPGEAVEERRAGAGRGAAGAAGRPPRQRGGPAGAAGAGRRARPPAAAAAAAPRRPAAAAGAAPRRRRPPRRRSRRPGEGVAARAPDRGRARASTSAASQGTGPEGRIVAARPRGRAGAGAPRRRAAAAAPAPRPARPAVAGPTARPSPTCRSPRSGRRSPAAGAVDRPDPDVLPHHRGRHGAGRGDAREALQGAGRRVQGLVQRHHHQGGRDRAAAASRVQRLVAGRPDPLLERGPRRHGGGDRGRADHAGDPARRPQALREIAAEARTSPAARASGSSSPRSTPAAPSRSPTSACSASTSSPRSSTRRRPASSRSAGSCEKPVAHEGQLARPAADAAHDVAATTG